MANLEKVPTEELVKALVQRGYYCIGSNTANALKAARKGIAEDIEYCENLIFDDIFDDLAEPTGADDSGKTEKLSIHEIGLAVRTRNVLARNGIAFVEDLENTTEREIRMMRGAGEKTVKDVNVRLAKLGARLAAEV